MAFEAADAGFARVLLDQGFECVFGDGDVFGEKRVGTHLFGHEVLLGNGEFFVFDITTQLDDFEPVAQWCRDGVDGIGRCNEKDITEVKRHVEIVIGKGIVLFGSENLEQCRSGIAAVVIAQFVDFVQ